MKLEKISDKKFDMFEDSAVKNLNAILGGYWETDRVRGGSSSDKAATNNSGTLDSIKSTNQGQTDDTNGDTV